MNEGERDGRGRERTRRARGGNLLAGGLALTLPVAVFWALAWAAGPTAGVTRPAPPPLAVPAKPSIPAGAQLYTARCARCHSDPNRFAERSWRASQTPAEVARMLLGRAAAHPAALHDLATAWDVTAYVWTLPDDGDRIRRGESLALQAEKALRSDALSVLLLHWQELQDLKSASWVLNHTAGDVDTLMRGLAGSRYTGLPVTDRHDLVDYVFASFYRWPPSW